MESTFRNLRPDKFNFTPQDDKAEEAVTGDEDAGIRKVITFPVLRNSMVNGNHILNSMTSCVV